MGQRERHTAVQKVRRAAAVVFTAGALISASSSSAFADMLEDVPLSGAENTDQDGEQNLACGNSARLVRLNVGQEVNREQVCVDDGGHTRRDSVHTGAAQAVGGATLGPQVNTAQKGKQNLACGNSADLLTVNAAGTMSWDTTCVVADYGGQYGSSGDDYTGGAGALGGTTVGPQVNTAQTGRQNVYCGNSADALTVNVVGTIRRHTTCTAADYSPHGSGETYRGRVSADAGQVIGPQTNTAQNGRQNQSCGNPGAGIDIPLGQSERQTRCTVHDSA
jgi:hypothetical protein